MDVQLSRAGDPRSGDPHGWNSFQNYLIRHNKDLDEHPFLEQSSVLSFQEITEGGVARIAVWGECLCRRQVSLIIRKELAFRYVGHIRQVRGVSYNYVAWIPGQNLVLKYPNGHENPDLYIHRAYNPQTGQQILYEELTRHQFPVLSEVLDEAELLTRGMPG